MYSVCCNTRLNTRLLCLKVNSGAHVCHFTVELTLKSVHILGRGWHLPCAARTWNLTWTWKQMKLARYHEKLEEIKCMNAWTLRTSLPGWTTRCDKDIYHITLKRTHGGKALGAALKSYWFSSVMTLKTTVCGDVLCWICGFYLWPP